MIRLNKYLAQCGLGSRRQCDQRIQSGKVTVNGKVVNIMGFQIDENHDEITCNGILVSREESKIYVLLNKPVGYVTTVKDGWERKTVTDLIPIKKRIFPVGRLDKDTEGLLLLTNDGNLCYTLTHPKFHVEKVYQIQIDKKLTPEDMKKLEQGLMLETGMTAPCKVELSAIDKTERTLEIILHEGKKRQIRNMFHTLGYSVNRLMRLKFAGLTIGNLPVGKWRYLTEKEVEYLRRISEQSKNNFELKSDY